ncbi:MFS transporter [Pseudonocardia oroxyli]|uniref:Predicted arabinose efflux permease, MFS family n=1 Tax=Pseudonocardia oroxyli TaxID=366584 RepID=A0A1G7KLV9_PSEOR|nr:MFS transporter [Pseudonocardia oroxyli]SDF38223.1 Predicted arabinose efflux permease, MFS family [Pseudonocardia oroxyli]
MGMKSWARVAAVLFVIGYGANQFSPLMVMYREQGHYSATVVAAFFGVYVAGLAPGLFVGGPLSDRYGRRAVLLPAVVLSVPASAVLALGAFSETLLFTGRFLFGLVTGVAMAVGSTWVKELSQAPHEPEADSSAGARRAALSLSAGFGVGPVVGGVLAQWAPLPMELPYLAHILVTLPVIVLVRRAPETRPRAQKTAEVASPAAGGWTTRLRDPRFRARVLPLAPWVFAGPAVSFAVQPAALGDRTAGFGLFFATLLTAVTLSAGVGIQSTARRLDARNPLVGGRLGLGLIALGSLVAALTAVTGSLVVAVVASAILGSGFGISLVSGLIEVQRIAAPDHLAGVTAVYYSLTYLGFLLPLVLAPLAPGFGYPALLVVVACLALVCLAVLSRAGARPGVTARPAR